MKAEPQVPNVDEGKPVGGWSEFFEAVKPLVSAATKIVHEERLGTKTTMRVGGAARIYAEPASVADLQVLLREARAWGGACGAATLANTCHSTQAPTWCC